MLTQIHDLNLLRHTMAAVAKSKMEDTSAAEHSKCLYHHFLKATVPLEARTKTKTKNRSGWNDHTTPKTSPKYANELVSLRAYILPDVRFLQPVFIQCVSFVM